MAPASHSDPDVPSDDSTSGSLGELLYSRPGVARPPEADWTELVHAIAGGDERALRTLYGLCHRVVFTLLLRMTARRDVAEELTVDVFHDVWRRAGTYDPSSGTVLGWILNQARSRAIDRIRHDARQKRGGHVVVESLPADAVAENVPETLQTADRLRLLRAALGDLTADEREAIEIAYFSALSYREVAEQLQQPLGTIKTRIRSGLAKLRDALAAQQEDL